MRIIGGLFKSRPLEMPKSRSIRPTQDRIRESIFNILGAFPKGARVLDLFSGSGAFGLEAISRGAKSAVFIDSNINSIKTIRSNLAGLGIEELGELIKADIPHIISKLYYNKEKFDLIFLDPPYAKFGYKRQSAPSLAKKTLIKLDQCDILMPSGIIVAEHFIRDTVPTLNGLALFKSVIYGDTEVSFLKKAEIK